MRNKKTGFPIMKNANMQSEVAERKAAHSSLRANGSIQTHPQERMRSSNNAER